MPKLSITEGFSNILVNTTLKFFIGIVDFG